MRIKGNDVYIALLAAVFLEHVFVAFPVFGAVGTAYLFLFLSLFPGTLVVLGLRIRNISLVERTAYALGLSLAFLMFVPLLLNSLLPISGMDRPLDVVPLLLGFDLCFLVLFLIAFRRNQNMNCRLTIRKPGKGEIAVITIGMLLPVIGVCGAFVLNNGGSDLISLSGLGLVAVAVVLAFVFRKRLRVNAFAGLLFSICLSLLLIDSLRGWNITGHDILFEYRIFGITKHLQHWDMVNWHDAYNACLSITILPTVYANFLGMDQYVYRLLFQILFSATPVALFLLFRRFSSTFASFLACVFFMSQAAFLRDFPYMVRQEIAILFYVLSLLVLFSLQVTGWKRNLLFLVFSFSMIVSHYSTAYFAVTTILIAYVLERVIRRIRFGRAVADPFGKEYYRLDSGLVLLPLFGAFVWYSVLTQTSDNLTSFVSDASMNIVTMIRSDANGTSDSLLRQFGLNRPDRSPNWAIGRYVDSLGPPRTADAEAYYDPVSYAGYSPYDAQEVTDLPVRINRAVADVILVFGDAVQKLMKVFILIGAGLLVVSYLRKREVFPEYAGMVLVNLLFLIGAILLPLIAVDYDLLRVYQQILVVIALPAVIGTIFAFKWISKPFAIAASTAVFVLYYLFVSPFIPQVVGNSYAHLQLNNSGLYYDLYYVHDSELASISWLASRADPNVPVSADWYTERKVRTFSGREIWTSNTLLPQFIRRDAYVYSGYTNTVKDLAFTFFGGEYAYRFPSDFLKGKDLVYSNGTTLIYK